MRQVRCCLTRKVAAAMITLPLATLLFVARVVLSVAELTGENVCHKRETYTVTMRVVVKEPMQVKTYTWCMKVPPRCTKYKTEMRDKFKIQTEFRERVVDICCAGYAPDRSETFCIPLCSGCLHGVCFSPDTCYCEPGYTGYRCDTECREGLWGSACGQQCRCQNGAACNHVTGDCRCADGWRGSICDVACPKGTYGHACMKECACKHSNRGENSTCHHVTGECRLSDESSSDYQELNTDHPTTVLPKTYTTNKPMGTQVHDKAAGNNEDPDVNKQKDNDTGTVVQQTENSVLQTENLPVSDTEKDVLSADGKFTAPVTSTTTSIPIISHFTTENEARKQIPNEVHNNSVTSIMPLFDHETDGLDSETDRKEDDDRDVSEEDKKPDTIQIEEIEQTTEEIGATEPQNIQIPPHGIIVVSDGLLSERRDEDKSEESRSGIWNLVSSASVAGGVALLLIVMAAVTLLVSHRRNKAKLSIAEKEMASRRKQQREQQQPLPGPQMYNCTGDVTTLPLKHMFPDSEFRPTTGPDDLQLCFGDVSGTMATNNNLGLSYGSYNNTRAFLELQYDIPPSSMGSKSNSLLPGMDPEHLYDEIPCWRSTATTSTNTDTSTSQC